MAKTASFSQWQQAQEAIEEVVSVIAEFGSIAKALGVGADTIRLIEKQLDEVWRDNQQLI